MKKLLFKISCFLIAYIYRLYFFIFVKPSYYGKMHWKKLWDAKESSILLIWHNDEIIHPYLNRNSDVFIMISLSNDGELLANILKHLGCMSIRGSSSRRGKEALQDMIETSTKGFDTCYATDGPRGPRHVVKPGAIVQASKTGKPIIAMAASASKSFIFNKSWDKGVLPLPFSKVAVFYSEPIYIPPDLSKDELEHYRLKVETILKRLSQNALNCFDIEYIGFKRLEKFFLLQPFARTILFYPISIIYGAIIQIRNFLFDKNILKAVHSKARVISIGNLTLGGSGKTPYTLFLAQELMAASQIKKDKIAIVTGNFSDESEMLTKKGFKVFKNKVKYKGVIEAQKSSPEVIIVDDGFQHRYFHRDENIVLINAAEEFSNNKMFPAGTLREPMKNLKRADRIILTRTDEMEFRHASIKKPKLSGKELRAFIRKYNSKAPIQESIFEPYCEVDLTDKNLLLISAISNPHSFANHARRLGGIVKKQMVFPDHYIYGENDYTLFKRLQEQFDYILTTEKDAAKLDISKIDFKVLKINSMKKHS
jgi:tetraacyldisaccharide 4'-kinase